MTIGIMVVIFAFFYLGMIRPQQKQRREFQAMVASLKRGDVILTSAGMYGTVKRIDDDVIVVEIAKGVTVKIPRRAVAEIISDPVKARALVGGQASTRRGRGKAIEEPIVEVEEEVSDVEAADVVEDESDEESAEVEAADEEAEAAPKRPYRRRK
jgi:preprotein translocase subunit YajC